MSKEHPNFLLKHFYVLTIVILYFIPVEASPQVVASGCSYGKAKFQVDSDSMLPFAPKGAVLSLECLSHTALDSGPQQHTETLSDIRPVVGLGDVVAFQTKAFGGSDGFKRIVGLPGNSIRFLQGKLIIDGKPVLSKPDGTYTWKHDDGTVSNIEMSSETLPNGATYYIVQGSHEYPTQNTKSIDVPGGYVFVVGDHRDQSVDSRNLDVLGLVRIKDLVAKVVDVTSVNVK